MQRKPAPTADAARQERAELTARWIDTAMRPDLYPPPIQRKGMGGMAKGASPVTAASSGQPIPVMVQAKMEQAFGADFSAVRIHEGPQATAMGALAYTQGTDIHFAPGQYDPSSYSGQALLGHELAHVVQQAQGRVGASRQAKGAGINDDASLEREADEMGARAARGQAVHGATAPASSWAFGANDVVQRKINLSTLESKLEEIQESGASYTETIDDDTDAVTANEVGEAWAKEGATLSKYGPPFHFRLLSADRKFQYRPPMVKKTGKSRGSAQANYEWRAAEGSGFTFNAHVTVTDIDQHLGGNEDEAQTGGQPERNANGE